MSATTHTLLNDPLYRSALQHLQGGEWEAGLNELNQLVEKYPLEAELRTLRQEMQIRARVDDYESDERSRERRRKAVRSFFTFVALLLVFSATIYGVSSYAGTVQRAMAEQVSRFSEDTRKMQLALTFRNGQDLLAAGKADLAMAQFEKVAAEDPAFPDLEYFMNEAERQASLEQKYQEALRMAAAEDFTRAIELLQEVQDEEPFYKDVNIQVENIRQNLLLTDMVAQAEQAFTMGEWEKAANALETIRSINPQYQADYIKDQLYNSYMNIASNALNEDSTDFANLEKAESNFRKALALRPQTPQAMTERDRIREQFKQSLAQSYLAAAEQVLSPDSDSLNAMMIAEDYFRKAMALQPNDVAIQDMRTMARNYLQAQSAFQAGEWDQAIKALQFVYERDSEYASGTALHTLYEALMQRGRAYYAAGMYTDALNDFLDAASKAEDAGNFYSGQLEAQLQAADTLGKMGDYERGTLVYQSMVEDLEALAVQVAPNAELEARRGRLDSAANYAAMEYYNSSFRIYKDVVPDILPPTVQFTHTVESGEYLTQIAKDYGTTVEKILEANKLGTSKRVRAGQQLIIPGAQLDTP